eukprot:TRINITY_DN1036_c0_g1_i4.p1 TRINITY_DN1036_c0_g1~~TRINITY_DN1036_c0_g1_i4.p1  ORF type:complete len:1112 (-),score=310.28 TRINITY_DN1036_c0_g1_i4:46-3381(-)
MLPGPTKGTPVHISLKDRTLHLRVPHSSLRRNAMVFLSIITFLFAFPPSQYLFPQHSPSSSSVPVAQKQFIVIFDRYMPHTEHRHIISSALGSDSDTDSQPRPSSQPDTPSGSTTLFPWTLVRRNNPAAQFPSDFAVITIRSKDERAVMKALQALPGVKHVMLDRQIINPLKSIEEAPAEHDMSRTLQDKHMQGRYHRGFSFNESTPGDDDDEHATRPFRGSRRLHASSLNQVTDILMAQELWQEKHTGAGIKVAIFDTGLRADHPHFKNVAEITNWTSEQTTDDGLGHGTFVAGLIAASDTGSGCECPGFAPDSELHVFRVFTSQRVSYTSWFLDAFNYAIKREVDVLNLSIGGPDFMDRPFVEKVWEMSANNIIIVSAIGNDGPLYGTLNNPADQLDVIGVGGIDFQDKIASFSSRGMTTWELPSGYGRVKPDIVTYGQSVQGSRIYGGCRALSGTSVASPVVAGAVALLASSVPVEERRTLVNPASMKQILIAGAKPLVGPNIFEQGPGRLDLLHSYKELAQYKPHTSFWPDTLDLTKCPYMWPYCTQPLYHSAMPVVVNVTILNGVAVTGEVTSEPVFRVGHHGQIGKNIDHVDIAFQHSKTLWPWSGYLAISITVPEQYADWEGDVEGVVALEVTSYPDSSQTKDDEPVPHKETIELPLKVRVVRRPPRHMRVLWDQFHNLRYPAGYLPRDALDVKDEFFDWNGDHMHTNFKDLYTHLREWGYYVETLGGPLTCFDASNYGTLMLVDSEDEYYPAEIAKLHEDVTRHGLNLVVVADWYNTEVMKKNKFFDENSRQWWLPLTGGANLPALNDLLSPMGIYFGTRVYDGEFDINGRHGSYSSGTALIGFPTGGVIVMSTLTDQSGQILKGKSLKSRVPILGIHTPSYDDPLPSLVSTNTSDSYPSTNNETDTDITEEERVTRSLEQPGKVVVFGDSNCLDNAHQKTDCYWLMQDIMQIVSKGENIAKVFPSAEVLLEPFVPSEGSLPVRPEEYELPRFSHVASRPLVCPAYTMAHYNWSGDPALIARPWVLPTAPPSSPVLGRGTGRSRPTHVDSTISAEYTHVYFLVYFIFGCGAVFFLIVLALRSRRTDRVDNTLSPTHPRRATAV